MINELLSQSVGPFIAIFLATAMFSLGLDLTPRQIVDSLRDKRLVTVSVLTNIAAIPLLVIVITSLIPMDEGLRIGIVVYAFAAGTEAGPKFVQIIEGNTAFSFGLLVLLLTFTVAIVPLILPLVIPGAQIQTGAVVAKLMLVVAAPIGVGLFLNNRYQGLASRLSPFTHRASMIMMYTLLVLLIYVNFREIASLQASAMLAGSTFFVIAFAAGYLAGGPLEKNRRALGIMTFARNGTISMMIASEVFTEDPQVLMMATIMTVTSVILAVLISLFFRRFSLSTATAE